MSNQPTPFTWGEIALSQTVLINGVPHATRAAIGEWLEYEYPTQAITRILERNSHIEKHSTVVKLTTVDDKNRDVSAYHPIGFLLIVMESGQPKAQAMKVAVAEFVWHFAGPRKMSFKEEMELMKLQRVLTNDLGKSKDAFVRQMLTERLSRVCLSLGQAMPDIKQIGKNADQLELPEI